MRVIEEKQRKMKGNPRGRASEGEENVVTVVVPSSVSMLSYHTSALFLYWRLQLLICCVLLSWKRSPVPGNLPFYCGLDYVPAKKKLKSLPPVSVKVALVGNRVLAEVIKLR